MKKMAFIFMAALAIVCLSTSCSKSKLCKCTNYWRGEYYDSDIVDTEPYGAKSCSKLGDILTTMYAEDATDIYKCTSM